MLNTMPVGDLAPRGYFDSPNATAWYGPLPPGVTPNFVDPVSRRGEMVAVNAVCIILCGILVGARLYSKTAITHSLGWDDYTCVIGFVFAVFYGACCLAMTAWGLGRHVWDVPFAWLSTELFVSDLLDLVHTPEPKNSGPG